MSQRKKPTTPPTPLPLAITQDGYLDAVAWLRTHVNEDGQGKLALTRTALGAEMLDGLTMICLSLLLHQCGRDEAAVSRALDELTSEFQQGGGLP